MAIDLAAVNWLYVVVLAVLVFVSALAGNLLSFGHLVRAAVLTAVVFAGLFVFWTYYPHGLPLPTTLTAQKATVAPAVPTTTSPVPAPARPENPIRDITPPATPAR
jgi:hypothetical protein